MLGLECVPRVPVLFFALPRKVLCADVEPVSECLIALYRIVAIFYLDNGKFQWRLEDTSELNQLEWKSKVRK